MFDERTATLNLPLPHPQNELGDDVARLRTAFGLIDARFAAIAALLASDDLTLDTVLEIANAIKDNRADLADILTDKVGVAAFEAALAGKADAAGTTAALALKADAAATVAALAAKAAVLHGHDIDGVAGLSAELALKADQAALTAGLALKADAAATTAALAAKVDAAAVNPAVSLYLQQNFGGF